MREIFVMNKEMHMGPINRNLREGDVLSWEPELNMMTLNGCPLPSDGRSKTSTEGFAEVARLLKAQADKIPEAPWADIRMTDSEGSPTVKTTTLAVLPVLGCLRAAEEWLGMQQNWTPVNDEQVEFMEHFIEHIDMTDVLGDNLVKKASDTIHVINAFLADHGFPDLQLTIEPGPGGFCVGSVLDVLCEWLKEGKKTTIDKSGVHYPAVRLGEGVAAFYNRDVHPWPVVKIRTKSGDVLCMSICGSLSSNKYATHWKVEALRRIEAPYPCEGVIFPMVKYESMIDISFMKGLRTSPEIDHWYVAEAIQKTRFRMNELGARAQSAAAMTMMLSCCVVDQKPWVIIDKPFILWIERKGMAIPLFEGVFAEDVWANPGGLQ